MNEANNARVIEGTRKFMNLVIYGIRYSCASLLVMFLLGFMHDNVNSQIEAIGFWQSLVLVSVCSSLYYCFAKIRPIDRDSI